MQTTNLPCPSCNAVIKINIHELLNGAAFTCENCKARISMKPENKEVLQHAMEKLEAFKKTDPSS
ncbi:hypothetical protein [Pedobacter chitinilyticus]|jgi:transcription elongation factor Elf1|uniref:hypothetical protein n=1 Tax=Pedobacter chitinilyticus TaxID=2233776 RepID=UPI000DE4A3F8|nr:hypothetical protein [Pedobacter chitinilyticus]